MQAENTNILEASAGERESRARQSDSGFRLQALDIVKTVAIFLMVTTHVGEVLFSFVWEDKAFCPSTGAWSVFDGWSTLLAPALFMFSMGVAINFSCRREPVQWVRRGFWLILTWFLLKAAYCLVGIRHVAASGLTPLQFCIQYVFYSDILCFAGLFFVVMGFLRRLNVPKTVLVLLALGLFCAGQFIHVEPTTSCTSLTIFVQAIVGLFVSTPITAFPFFHWALHPILGLGWGWLMLCSRNRDRFFGVSLLASLPVLLGIVAWYAITVARTGDLPKMDLVDSAYVVKPAILVASYGVFVFLCSASHFLVRRAEGSRFARACGFIGSRLTVIYCIQWVVIPCVDALLPMWPEGRVFSPAVILGCAVAVCAVCIALAEPVRRLKVRVFGGR